MLAPRSYRHLITMLTLDLKIPPAAATRARLRQFLIYDDHAAGVAARWLGSEIHAHAARHCAVTSEMWKLEVATRFVMFRETTLQEAGEADVIVVAVSNPGAPEPGFEDWLESLAHGRGRSGRDGLLIGPARRCARPVRVRRSGRGARGVRLARGDGVSRAAGRPARGRGSRRSALPRHEPAARPRDHRLTGRRHPVTRITSPRVHPCEHRPNPRDRLAGVRRDQPRGADPGAGSLGGHDVVRAFIPATISAAPCSRPAPR